MLFNFNPWKIDVDILKTKELYKTQDFSVNKEENQKFAAMLNEKQKEFFEKLAVDVMKIQVETVTYGEAGGDDSIQTMKVNFLFCGRFAAMPANQIALYQDEEYYGEKFDLSQVESVPLEVLAYDFDGLGTGIRFKHPILHYEGEQYKKWDCGYVYGAMMIYSGE